MQQWREDGQLAAAAYETFVLRPSTVRMVFLTSLLMAAPEKGPQFRRWLEVTYNDFGRLRRSPTIQVPKFRSAMTNWATCPVVAAKTGWYGNPA